MDEGVLVPISNELGGHGECGAVASNVTVASLVHPHEMHSDTLDATGGGGILVDTASAPASIDEDTLSAALGEHAGDYLEQSNESSCPLSFTTSYV